MEMKEGRVEPVVEREVALLVPSCKPLRIIEMFIVVTCFTLLFFLRSYTPDQTDLVPPSELIVLFLTFGSLMLLTGGDVFTQLVKEPTSNIPMIFVCLIGCIFSSVCGVFLVITYHIHSDCPSKRILNVIGLIAGGSFLSTIVYLLDVIILIRFV